ncbi:MAG TPA: PAS domain S-box protein [Xanthobacteraceae bacterium]|jgi:PAS domain S-box-containing protein|nr:PAS domain S-box protein [Xanthobacteraceae bacterium]
MSGQGHKTIRKVGRKKVEGSNAVAKAAAPRAPSPTVLDAFTLISQSSLDAIPTGFCVCRADTSLVRYNKRATELWGRELPLGEPTVRFAGELRRYRADGEPLHFGATPVAQALRTGERVTAAELVIEQPDGSRVPVLMNVQPLKDHLGRIEGAVCSFQELTERKRAEEALRASEAELQSVINRTPFMLVRCSRDMRYRFISDAYAHLIGQTRAEILGKTISEVLGEQGLATLRPYTERVLRGEAVNFECNLDFANVGSRRLLIAYRPELDAKGKAVGWIASLLDVTEQRRAEAAMARRADEQTALYRFTDRLYRAASLNDVYEATLDAIIAALHCRRASIQRFDSEGVMRFSAWRGLSDSYRLAAEGLSPWRADDVNPEPICIGDVGNCRFGAEIKAAAKQEGIGALAFVPLMVAGKVIGKFVTYYDAPREFAREDIDLTLNLARQLGFGIERMRADHARTRIEAELRKLSERLEAEVHKRTLERDRIWNVSEDLLAVSNFEGFFLSINPAWMRLLGWNEAEIKSMNVSELRHPEDAAHSIAAREQLARGELTVRLENRFRHKDGSYRWLQWTMTESGGLIYLAGRHVTAEKETAAALERAQRQTAHLQKMDAIGQLTGGIAHDFNNLLMIVSGHAQRLKNHLKETRDQRAVAAIEMAATRGENLTRQLLSFARTLPLSPTVISPAETVHAIRDVLSGSMYVNIDFQIEVPDDTWPVHVDKSELELVLVNLSVNARDAIPFSGGRVVIAAENVEIEAGHLPEELSGDFVALSVADNGSGIPHDLLSRVVEPFFTTKGPDKGTGLGLSQVYGFARRSGGTVAIDSEPGRGTTVTVYLPRSHAAVAAPSPQEDGQYIAAERQTVLVVEDNADVRNVAVSLLKELGYRTIEAETAPAALEVLANGKSVRLVFSDVVLPGQIDGLALARTVCSEYPHIPVVLTTGYTKVFETDPEFPLLRKPYQIAALGRVIHDALDAARAKQP